MAGKPLTIWADLEEIKIIKERSKKEKRSVSNFIKCKVFQDEKN